MNVKTCDRCGRLFETFLESNHCKDCTRVLEERLDAVRQFLKANETASLEEVCIALKVERKQVISWIRQNRLEFPEASGVTVPCQKCGEPVRIGRFCPFCRTDIMQDLESVIDKSKKVKSVQLKTTEKNTMHFLNRHRKR